VTRDHDAWSASRPGGISTKHPGAAASSHNPEKTLMAKPILLSPAICPRPIEECARGPRLRCPLTPRDAPWARMVGRFAPPRDGNPAPLASWGLAGITSLPSAIDALAAYHEFIATFSVVFAPYRQSPPPTRAASVVTKPHAGVSLLRHGRMRFTLMRMAPAAP